MFSWLLPVFAAAWVWEEEEGGGQESPSWQAASVGHVVFCFWEASVLQHQRLSGYHQAACGKTWELGYTSFETVLLAQKATFTFSFNSQEYYLILFFFSDLLEGNPAWYWHLQCEGNTQEHLGAQARVQALPRRGKDWWIVFESKGQYMLSTQRDFLLDQSLVWPGFCTSGLKMHWTMRWSFAVPSHSVGTKIKGTMEKSEVRPLLFLMWFPFTAWVCSLVF